ncbi:MAG: YqgE/AlgH family protein [Crocinitomicaceae bacterium]|nr:YqgE/AlgH family protein [Crocinitomicaceae bacterium]
MDFSFKNKNTPKKGALLLSDPFEMGAFFTRAVVLICDYNDKGTFGFVLNNYLNISADSISDQLVDYDGRISIGGPVDNNNLFYIHQFEDIEGSEYVTDGVYFGGDFLEIVKKMNESEENSSKIRFFAGYSGWDAGQLEDEIKQHSWIVAENHTIHQIMDTSNDDLWKELMSAQGTKYKVLADVPLDPTHN